MIIYKATNKINGMSYIGQSNRPLKIRINEHMRDVKKKRYISFFHRALTKYGLENFDWSVIKKCKSKNELDEHEKYYISFLNTIKPHGYNLTPGGIGGTSYRKGKTFIDLFGEKKAKILKKKLSDSKMGKPGKKHNEISKIKIGKASRKWHKENPNNNSLVGKNHPMWRKKGTFLGKNHSEDTKKKISEIRKEWFRQNPGIYDGSKNPNWRQDNA